MPSAPTTTGAVALTVRPPEVAADAADLWPAPPCRRVFGEQLVDGAALPQLGARLVAASTRIASSTMRRGAYASRTPSAGGIPPVRVNGPTSIAAVVIAGQPERTSSSSSPQRFSAATPGCQTRWVDSRMSLGNVLRSTSSTRCPWRASSMAVDAPAHRAPTTITSYISLTSRSVAARPAVWPRVRRR